MQRSLEVLRDDSTPPKSPFVRPHMNFAKSASAKSKLQRRIWALILLLGFVFILTRLFSHSSSQRHPFYDQESLHPRNYLNGSLSASNPPPFSFCPVHGPGDTIGQKYGPSAMAKSRLHLGSGARIQRVIHRAMSGLPVTISVIGGSISACHGVGSDALSPSCWPTRFFLWWNSIFPNPATQLTNGSRRRTDSSYFSFCHSHHLPDAVDLILLDFDTEDSTSQESLEHFEQLVRSLLNRPDAPAVLIMGHFSPQFQQSFAWHGPEINHGSVAQFYDVPHISIKGPMYAEYLEDPESFKSNFFVDPVLANKKGHELLSDVLVSYFQAQVCRAWDSALGYIFDVPLGGVDGAGALLGGNGLRAGGLGLIGEDRVGKQKDKDVAPNPFKIPSARMNTRLSDLERFREAQPFCVSADDLINPLPPSLFYGSGWHVHHPGSPGAIPNREDVVHFWYATLPSSKLRVPIKVGSGDIAVYVLQEDGDVSKGSTIECWVDDNYNGRVAIQSRTGQGSGPKVIVIDHGVSLGSHFVECQLLGQEGRAVEPFRLLGIFAT